jgi:hypothetical protein
MSVIAEPTLQVQEVLDFLNREIKAHNFPITLYGENASQWGGRFVKIPAFAGGDFDAVDSARMLQSVEDAWNDRDPEPALIVTLVPTMRQKAAGQ